MVKPPARLRAVAVILLLVILAAVPALSQEKPAGGVLRGTVYDKDFGVPLGRVRVTVVETGYSTFTNQDGVFLLEGLPPGAYTLTFTKEGFDRALATGVSVTVGRMTDFRQDLSAEILELDEMVVTGVDFLENSEVGLLEVRAVAVVVQDAISADLIRQAGAGDVAGALKLVTGASVVEGKYATVRGLSDRYTGVTLNGVRVPSADPRKRAAQIDLFPTGTVDSITVTKTFSPDLYGDFTGGGVDIRTKSIPEGPALSVSTSIEHNSQATGNRDFLTNQQGGVERAGFQNGERDLPAVLERPLGPLPNFNPRFITEKDILQSKKYDRFTRAVSPVMGVHREGPEYNHGFSISGGNRYTWGQDSTLGLVGALTYAHKYEFYENGRNNSAGVSTEDGEITLRAARNDSKGTDEILLGILGSVVYQPGEQHEWSLKLIGNHSTADENRFQIQQKGPESQEHNQSLQYAERSVVSLQLQGSNKFLHLFSKNEKARFRRLELDWSISPNFTRQDEPDVRFFRNTFNQRTLLVAFPANSSPALNTRRIWRRIDERNGQIAFNAAIPFQGWGAEGRIKFGAYWEDASREYKQRSYSYLFATQFGRPTDPVIISNRSLANYVARSADDLWTDVFAGRSRTGLAGNRCAVGDPPCTNVVTQLLWYLTPIGNDVDYTGDQTISAYYGMFEFPLGPRLKLLGGLRQEKTELSIVPIGLGGLVTIIVTDENLNRSKVEVPQEQAEARLDRTDRLPAYGLIWDIREKMKLRLNYGRTLARPTFRELAPVATEEFIFGDEFLGTPSLKISTIDNYDLRWEWFPGAGDLLAFSLFAKRVQDPIEYIAFGAGSEQAYIQPINYPKGTVKGAEIEARLDLVRLTRRLTGFAAGFNASYLKSEVVVPASERTSLAPFALDQPTRPLQGQPEYIANFNFTYDDEKSGTSFGLFVNRIGEILSSGAARGNDDGIPDIIELPFTSLDVTFSRKLGKHLSLSAKGSNLLNSERQTIFRVPNGNEAVKSLRTAGRNLSFGVSYKW